MRTRDLCFIFALISTAYGDEWILLENNDISAITPKSIWSEPHNCSGNVDQCSDGFSLQLTYQPDTQGDPNVQYHYVISSGGQNFRSNGYYIRQVSGKFYEFGVAVQDKLWELSLSLAWGSQMNIAMTWNQDDGLAVFVDGMDAGTAAQPKTRIHGTTAVPPHRDVWIGQANDGTVASSNDISVGRVRVQDSLLTEQQLNDISTQITGDLKIGCMQPPNSAVSAPSGSEIDAASCRRACHGERQEIAVYKDGSCKCLLFEAIGASTIAEAPCNEDYGVYFAQHVIRDRSFLDTINLEVNVVKPTSNDYTRPLETITLALSSALPEGSDVTYTADFGDGFTLVTMDTEIGHAYTAEGTYSIQVTAKTLTAEDTVFKSITIENVDETKAPEPNYIRIDPEYGASPGSVHLHADSFSTTSATCTYDLQDGRGPFSFANDISKNMYVISNEEEFIYNKLGVYNVEMTCSNQAGEKSVNYLAIGADPDWQYAYTEFTPDTTIAVNVNGDTDQVDVKLNGISLTVGQDYQLSDGQMTLSNAALGTGEHVLQLSSNGRQIFTKTYNLQKPVQEVTVSADPMYTIIGEDVTFEFMVKQGSEVHGIIDYGDGTVERVYLHTIDVPYTIRRSHQYNSLDAYVVSFTVANDVSTQRVDQAMHIQRGMEKAEMTIANQTVLGEPTDFIFSVDLHQDTVVPFNVEMYYDDDSEPSVFVLGQAGGNNKPIIHQKVYSQYGIYRVKARVYNYLSSLWVYGLHQVGENLTLVDVEVVNDHAEVGEDIVMLFSVPRGSPIHLMIDTGDGDGFEHREPSSFESDKDCRKYPEVLEWYMIDDEDDEEDEESNGTQEEETKRRRRRYTIRRLSTNEVKRRKRSLPDYGESGEGSGDYEIDFSGELDESMFDRTTPVPTAPAPTPTPNDVFELTYSYEEAGEYHVSVKVSNCFNEVETVLCPEIVIADVDRPEIQCNTLELSLDSQDNEDDIPSFYRSEDLTLTATSNLDCAVSDGYVIQEYVTWRPERKTAYDEWRPSPDFCGTEIEGTQVTIPGNSFSYGVHKMTATLWIRLARSEDLKSDKDLGSGSSEESSGIEAFSGTNTDGYADKSSTFATMVQAVPITTYFKIVSSPLIAEIKGSEEDLVYNNSISVPIDISGSRDPDVIKPSNWTGFMSFVFCFSSSLREEMEELSLSELVKQSVPKARNLDKNVYVFDLDSEEDNCFQHNSTIKVYDHSIRVMDIKNNEDLSFLLVATKDVREAREINKIRVMSVDLSNSDALLDILTEDQMMKDPGTGIMVCGVVADNIKSAGSGSEVTKTVSKLMGKTEFLSMYAENYDQVMGVTDVVGGVTEDKDNVDTDGQEKAAGSLGNAAETATKLGDQADEGKVEDLFNKVGGGAAQVIPFKTAESSNSVKAKKKIKSKQNGEEDEEEEDTSCCGKIYGMCEWIEAKDEFLPELFRKSYAWDELECNVQPPDDIKEIQVRYDAYLEEEALKAKEQDHRTSGKGMGSVGKMASLLGGKQEPGKATVIPSMNCQVQKMDEKTIDGAKRRRRKRKKRAAKMGMEYTCNDFGDENVADEDCRHGVMFGGNICLPDSMVEQMTTKSSIMSMNTANPFDGEDVNADVATLEISMDGASQTVAGESCPIVISITGEPRNFQTEVGFVFIDSEATKQEWSYRTVPITVNETALYITLKPENLDESYKVAVTFEGFPNDTHHDFITEISGNGYTELFRQKRAAVNGTEGNTTRTSSQQPPTTTTAPTEAFDIFENVDEYYAFTIRVPANLTERAGNYTIGIRGKSAKMALGEETKRNISYHFATFTHKCLYWSKSENIWTNDGCRIAANSNPFVTRCLCDHLTSFGGDMVVPPNTINFATVFSLANFLEAMPVFLTVALSIILYIVALIWARREDQKDLIKWGASPLEDNLPTDTYHYQLTVNTAVKKKAGTKSKISFILSGDESDTGVRRLYDGKRKEFPSGSIYNFILSVENCLGPLTYLRIWHDNSGNGKNKGWYLDQVQLTDLQTGEKFIFLLDRWLAIEEDDGQVERIIPVAGMNDLSAFKHLFNSSFRKKLTNDHMWFSVISRPTRSSFTRVQRISCCVSLLFLTMITNCMFFKSDERPANVTKIALGPIEITLQQIFISIVCTGIVLPPSIAIVTIFRKAKPKDNTIMQSNQTLSQKTKKFQWKSVNGGSMPWSNQKRSRVAKMKESVRNIVNSHLKKSKYETNDPELERMKKKKKKGGKSWPHWTLYIAWTLVWLSIIASGFFTVLYSMEWGREKALDWLMTFFLSFFQNVVIVQPAKVLILAAVISCIFRKPELEDEEEISFDEVHTQAAPSRNDPLSTSQIDLQELIKKRQMAANEIGPPDTKSLEEARQLRVKEMAMESILKECIVYVFFILVLFFLSYETRDSSSFTFAQNIKNTFVDTSPSFGSINKPDSFWKWVHGVLMPNLYSSNWYNGKPLSWDEALQIDDRNTIRVGVARFRQLRIQDDSCKVEEVFQSVIKHCRTSYGWVDDDVEDYRPKWVLPEGNDTISERERETSSWVYRNSFELKSAPYLGLISNYKGGGYTFSFLRNPKKTSIMLKGLEQNGWVNPNTRGLFVEFTLYNANVNLFASCILLIEFMDVGGAITKTEVKVFRLSSYVGSMGIIVIIFEALYACFTIYFFVNMVRQLRKKKWKYFKDGWDLLEFATLIMCLIVIIMYAMKKVFGAAAMSILEDSGSGEYVNFVTISVWDEIFGFVLAIVVFLATVKFIKMLKFNRRMGMMGDTIAYCVNDLKIFGVTFMIYFMAFCMMAYKLFGNTLEYYATFITTIESLFAFALGSFDFDSLRMASSLGPIFFFLYVAVVQIGLMSMFLTIICDGFAAVKEETAKKSNEYELVEFIMGKVKGLFGQK